MIQTIRDKIKVSEHIVFERNKQRNCGGKGINV
jgi:hypothetical protein